MGPVVAARWSDLGCRSSSFLPLWDDIGGFTTDPIEFGSMMARTFVRE